MKKRVDGVLHRLEGQELCWERCKYGQLWHDLTVFIKKDWATKTNRQSRGHLCRFSSIRTAVMTWQRRYAITKSGWKLPLKTSSPCFHALETSGNILWVLWRLWALLDWPQKLWMFRSQNLMFVRIWGHRIWPSKIERTKVKMCNKMFCNQIYIWYMYLYLYIYIYNIHLYARTLIIETCTRKAAHCQKVVGKWRQGFTRFDIIEGPKTMRSTILCSPRT